MSTAQPPHKPSSNEVHEVGIAERFHVDAGKNNEYLVELTASLADTYSLMIQAIQDRPALVMLTPSVQRIYGAELSAVLQSKRNVKTQELAVVETSKTLRTATRICSLAKHHKLGRNGVMVAMGGGVLMDVVSTAASLFRRGISHLRIPTTLIGQVDAGIGIKGSINFEKKKSHLGCFYPPERVLICPAFLRTLPSRHIRGGLSEMIKIAIVRSHELFGNLEDSATTLLRSNFQQPSRVAGDTISSACVHMLSELAPNLFEDQTYERKVDFGHTFSPLIESLTGFEVSHGDAVSVDMALSSSISRELGLIDTSDHERILSLLSTARLPLWHEVLTYENCEKAITDAARHRAGNVNLVVPTSVGSTDFLKHATDVPPTLLTSALGDLRKRASQKSSSLPGLWTKTTCNRDQEVHLVLDVGGTSIRAGKYNVDGAIEQRAHEPTPNHLIHSEADFPTLAARLRDAMATAADQCLDGIEPDFVSVAFAGPIDADGYLTAAPTIWGQRQTERVDLHEMFRDIWPNSELRFMNDVTAAGYRFLRHDRDSLVVITVGSGIGNKTFVDGKPWTGPKGRGGEIGHIRVDHSSDAPMCECGGKGHLGAISSGRGTLALAKRTAEASPTGFSDSLAATFCEGKVDRLNNEHLVLSFHKNDPWTTSVVRESSRYLGQVLSTIHMNLGIERFVIYGGFGLALGSSYRTLLVEAAADGCWDSGQDWNEMIELGAPDGDSGLIGAGRSREFWSR